MNPWPDERAYLTAWWRYGLAIWAWDRGEPQYLAHVVASGYIIPPQLAPIVGDIIGGKRTVNDKAVAKLKAGSIASAVAACRLACARDIERAQRASAKDDGRQARTKSDSAPIAVRRDSDDNREAPPAQLFNHGASAFASCRNNAGSGIGIRRLGWPDSGSRSMRMSGAAPGRRCAAKPWSIAAPA